MSPHLIGAEIDSLRSEIKGRSSEGGTQTQSLGMRLEANYYTIMVACNRATTGCGVLLLVVVAFAFLYAGPWNSILLGKKGGGDIWSDCSKFKTTLLLTAIN